MTTAPIVIFLILSLVLLLLNDKIINMVHRSDNITLCLISTVFGLSTMLMMQAMVVKADAILRMTRRCFAVNDERGEEEEDGLAV